MNVVTAYMWKMTGKDVVVTILDDGIEKDHPDLSKNYVRLIHSCTSQLTILPETCGHYKSATTFSLLIHFAEITNWGNMLTT